MNYKKLYKNLISNAKNQKSTRTSASGTYENHHIRPRCIGGTNDKNNIVKMTLREHYVAHKILYRMYNRKSYKTKMSSALYRMAGSGKMYSKNSREYENMRLRWMDNHPMKDPTIVEKMKQSLYEYRINNDWKELLCKCGCGEVVKLLHKDSVIRAKYKKGHP